MSDGVLATDAKFQIDNQYIDESVGIEDNGVLVVFNTENVFSSSSTRTIKCTNNSNMAQALVALDSMSLLSSFACVQLLVLSNSRDHFVPIVFRPPVIMGETTLNEGDTLDLVCDITTSSPLPSTEWFSPQGYMISNSQHLEIINIQRSAMGIYTCLATQFGATLNITVNVTVLCE